MKSEKKYAPAAKIIIIDDASEDGTANWLKSLDDNLKSIAGIYVEQKKLSTILKQYVKLIDDSYALKIGENYLIPSKKKSRDSRTK